MLRRWQETGLSIQVMRPRDATTQAIVVQKPSWFKSLGYRLVALSGLRRNTAAGFGAVIPIARSGGGYG